jgi:hypothetical protein
MNNLTIIDKYNTPYLLYSTNIIRHKKKQIPDKPARRNQGCYLSLHEQVYHLNRRTKQGCTSDQHLQHNRQNKKIPKYTY